ncbi:RNA methyltransferase [Thauera humireducens]|uniref:TrmH family RNA methyltransferase n=1 Tax=Thauera humireducens TaxID=1134435 RepID=UPI00311FFF7B
MLAIIDLPAVRPLGTIVDNLVVLDGVQDPGNLGTILRTAAAAGVRHVLLAEGCAGAWSPRVLRAGMGAHFVLEVHERVDLAAWLPASAVRCSRRAQRRCLQSL